MKQVRVYSEGSDYGPSAAEYASSRIARGKGGLWNDTPMNIEAQLERTQKAVGKLLSVLRLKSLITDSEFLEVIDINEYDQKREQIQIKIEED